MELPTIEQLNLQGSPSEIEEWVERFYLWCSIRKGGAQNQSALFLTAGDRDLYSLLRNLAFTEAPAKLPYESLKSLLLNHLLPTEFQAHERAKFSSMIRADHRLVVTCSNDTGGMHVQPAKLEVDDEPIFLKRRVIPYGQSDGTAIVEVFRGLEGVLAYQDDVIVFGTTKAEHDDRLLKLLERFAQNNVSIRATKFVFCSHELEFSGFTVDAKGYRSDPSCLRPLTEHESPRD
ncbi:unnamed protein product [Echinostoma caproni]|uniref:Reverse transcriptase domain-containing protein n=1 Tax=Echinostoma caproni TaxID=27848 RepID=A0A183AWU6_9TREM|nr:unnamed protein product [Echinostoma caproni]